MSTKLDDEEIIDILRLYMDVESLDKAGEESDHAHSTVKKYVSRAKNGELEIQDDLPEDVANYYAQFREEEEFEEQLADPKDEVADVLHDFFERVGEKTSLRPDSMEFLIVDEAREHGDIPTAADLFGEILSGTTGVDNQTVAERIVSRYERLIQHDGTIQRALQRGDITIGSTNWRDQPHGSQPQFGGMGQQQQPMRGGMPMGQVQQPGGGMNQQPMMMMFQQMQQQMETLREEIRSSRKPADSDTIKRKTEEFLERRLEQMIEGEAGQMDQAVLQELQALRQELGRDAAPMMPGEGSWRQQVMNMVTAGQMDPDRAERLIEKLEGSDKPVEVLEKEYEKDIKEMEMEHQSDRYERIAEIGENAVTRMGEAFGRAIIEGGEKPASDDKDADSQADEPTQDTAGASATTDASAGSTTATSVGTTTPPQGDPDPEPEREAEPVEAAETAADPDPGPEPSQADVEASPAAEGTATTAEAEVKPDNCEHCGGELLQGEGQEFCMNCEAGTMPCDNCTFPVDIPPLGEESFAACPECDEIIEKPSDDAESVSCDECEWAGEPADLGRDHLFCDECETYRPIVRLDETGMTADDYRAMMGVDSALSGD